MLFLDKINEIYIGILKKLRIDKFFPSNIFIFLFVFFVFCFFYHSLSLNYTTLNYIDEAKYIPKIVDDSKYKLDLSGVKKIDKLSIKIGTFQKKVNGSIDVVLYKNDKKIDNYKIYLKNKPDNSYFDVVVKLDKIKKNDDYSIKIANTKLDHDIAIFETNDHYLYSIYSIKSLNNLFCYIIFVLSFIFMFIINYIVNKKNISIESFFLILGVYFLMVCLIIPPFHAPDEYYHFTQSYGLSQRIDSKKSIEFNSNYNCLMYGKYNLSNNVYSLNSISDCFRSSNSKKSINFDTRTQQFNPAHIVISLFIRITRVFTENPLIVFYSGRIANLLLNMFLIFLSIKIIPTHKKSILFIATIPVFIQQFVTYSYDGLSNSLSLLLVAYIMKLKNESSVLSIKNYLLLILMSSLLMIVKLPYVVFTLLLLLLDRKKFGKSTLFKYVIIMLMLVSSFIVFKGYNCIANIFASGLVSTNQNSIADLIFNPIYTASLLKNTMVNNTAFYITSMIGGLDWLNVYIDNIYIILIIVMFFVISLSEQSSYSVRNKLIIIAVNIVIILGILVALYLSWTAKDSWIIEGVQGRYFLPLLLPFMIVNSKKCNNVKVRDIVVQNYSNIIVIVYILTVLIAYY